MVVKRFRVRQKARNNKREILHQTQHGVLSSSQLLLPSSPEGGQKRKRYNIIVNLIAFSEIVNNKMGFRQPFGY
jgi:hypothetical protein